MRSAVGKLARALAALAERGEGLANCSRRATELAARLDRWADGARDDLVRWLEAYTHALALHATPLAVAEPFRRQLEESPRAWILTSATLAAGGDFGHYQRQLGLEQADTASWESPFDYPSHALLYLPRGLPEPNTPAHTDAVVDAALPVLAASGGRAFLLFTTLRAMRHARERLEAGLRGLSLRVPLLAQGEGSRSELLERFRRLGNAVLVGSQSFWEGVDVRGEALSVVVIDKLPFAPPDDPVLAARLAHLRASGHNPFFDFQLPQAAIALKQGAGRLIRDEHDRGVLMLCDPRVVGEGLRPDAARQPAADEADPRPCRSAGVLRTPGERLESSRLGSRRRARHESLHLRWRRLHRIPHRAAAARARHARRPRREAGSDQPDQALRRRVPAEPRPAARLREGRHRRSGDGRARARRRTRPRSSISRRS